MHKKQSVWVILVASRSLYWMQLTTSKPTGRYTCSA
jgi:hypothetical protein